MDKIGLTINGIGLEVNVGTTVLEAAREAGIYVPTLCSRSDLPLPIGNCRLCVVQIEGRGFPSSCITAVADGMIVHTDTRQVQEIRRHVLKAILSALPSPRLKRPELRRLADYIGVKEGEVPPYVSPELPVVWDEPAFELDHNRCILCGLCVRICHEVRGVGAIDFVIRDGRLMIGPSHGVSLKDAGCRFCGACVEVCPTSALTDKDGEWPGREAGVVPCTYACPAEIDVPRYVRLVAQRRFAEAAAVIRERVPFPGVLSRVCFHPCEEKCQRGRLDEPVSIGALKRVCAERDARIWRAKSTIAKSTGKRVAIVGSGPAGLTAGFYLAKLGHSVTIFEALPEVGGMMRVGIPEYRLPREVLASEIEEIRRVGVDIRTNARVESLDGLFEQGYDAVFLAMGAHQAMKMGVEGEERPGVMDCTSFLRDVNLGREVRLPANVAVIGGGNAAIDSARTALRVGASGVTIIYRRSRAEMPAYPGEVEAALEEGVNIIFLAAPDKITGVDGSLKVECIRMEIGEPDESGRGRPVPIKGSEFVMDFDRVIAAIGQMPEIPDQFGLEVGDGNTLKTNPNTLSTSRERVFAGGDVGHGPASVVEAIAEGRRAAISIDKHLGGTGIISEKLVEVEAPSPWLGPGDGFADISRVEMSCLPVEQRPVGFAEVELGLAEEMAMREAKRCLQCQLRLEIPPMETPLAK